jgi:DNA-binding response OmpR family regulator
MTVTPISSHEVRTNPRGRRTIVRRRRTTVGPIAEPPGLTVSFEVTLAGDSRYTDALEILDTLRLVTDRLGTATLEISPVPDDTAPAHPGNVRALHAEAHVDGARIQIQPDSRSVLIGTQRVDLTRVEFDLLSFLAENPRRVFTRPQLLKNVWGYEHTGERTVDVHIRRLRSKLGDTIVTTVRSVGYRLADDASIRVVRPH